MYPGTKIDFGRWIKEKDNGELMLRCPKCGSRVIWESYQLAIGTHGIRFCPYCGDDLRKNKGGKE